MRRALPLAAVASCSPPEPAHDIAYYRDHPSERATKMAACQNDRGKLAATPNCINAISAESEAQPRRFWRQAPPAPRLADPGKL